MIIQQILFLIVFVAVTIDLTGLYITKFTKFRTWPPVKDTKLWYMELVLTWTWTPGFFIVSLLTINLPMIWGDLWLFSAGLIIFVAGLIIDILGIKYLDSGYVKEGELITTGIYQYTRNPQYVGSLLMGIGTVIFTNSAYSLVIAIPAALWFITAPYVEEKLLLQQYGDQYKEYCEAVPRFV